MGLAAPPLPHHRAYGAVHGGSTDLSCGIVFKRCEAEPDEEGMGQRIEERGTVADAPWAMALVAIRAARASVPWYPVLRPSPFTLRLQGQFQLDILPLAPHEPAVLLTLPVVRPLVSEPTTVPYADFCATITGLAIPLSPELLYTTQTSRSKTDASTTHPPGRPCIRFLPIGSRLCSTLPPDPTSRQRPCASLIPRRHQAG